MDLYSSKNLSIDSGVVVSLSSMLYAYAYDAGQPLDVRGYEAGRPYICGGTDPVA
ncbi:hypothetical protein J22TS3_40130 [Paenibacillus sp. J22TS3]|nr:hypothetical protein J22TS3_40130 [Paenibacillus sp. J22TS3]